MIRSVIFVVLISIVFTQCLPPNDKSTPLKLNKSIKANSLNGKSLGNFTKLFDAKKSNLKQIHPYHVEKEYKFGERGEDDGLLGLSFEVNYFDGLRDLEFIVGYPNTGPGKFIVTYVEVYVFQESNDGSAEISKGGIGEQGVEIKISANQIDDFLYYEAAFYGHQY
ncbi:uncharacterized protein LOC129567028 [Sitodiplosis mosellana]|uniref:uncharacterized protein LOC129567028 n=1 Tax=Sitodiplosis mosellana TaxID=263140 RepID=UPI0024448CBA|nr:uncharacterized protein LOC129567028 [Sitodiplosis mosellana]